MITLPSTLRLEEITDMASLERIAAAWEALAARSADDSPYLTPQFLLPWVQWLGGAYRPRVLAAWRGDELAGLAPVFDRRQGQFGLRFRTRGFPLYGITPPLDLIGAEDAAVATLFAQHWSGERDWDLLHLANVPATSPTAAALRGVLRDERVLSREGKPTIHVPVRGSWDDFFGTRSSMLRRNYRRAWKRCEAEGRTRIVRGPSPDVDRGTAIDRLLDVVGRSWKRAGEDDERARWDGFFRDLARRLDERGRLVVRLLEVGDKAIAALMEIDYRGSLHAFHIAYDAAYQEIGPGVLLLADGIREAHERGCRRYDLGGSGHFYLHRWADAQTGFQELHVLPPRALRRLKARAYLRMQAWKQERTRARAEAMKAARKNEARAAAGSEQPEPAEPASA